MHKHLSVLFAGLLTTGLLQARMHGQSTPAGWQGSYSDAQASRGEPLYAANCATCHGADLAGSEKGPALAGVSFAARWTGRTLTELLDYIHLQMPLNSAGGLSRQQSADVLAYMLRKGGVPAGGAELSGGPMPPPRDGEASKIGTGPAGYYTRAQALRGRTAYNRNCLFCHPVDANLWTLENNSSIGVRTLGGRFIERVYHGRVLYPSVYHLYTKLLAMPGFDNKAISPQVRADILAYILERNDLPAGEEELTPDAGRMKAMPLGERGFEPLFNGRDFSGLKFVIGPNCLAAPDGCAKPTPGNVLRVEDGEMRCECNVHGYFYFDRTFKDFTFRFEQKFELPPDWDPNDPLYFGGTGVLLFIQPPHRVWPRSVEIEGRYYDLGEPLAIRGKGKVSYDHKTRLRVGRPVGEWDQIEIVSRAGTVTTSINGIVVSTFTDHDYPAGFIGVQTEGAVTWWRNIRIKPE
jgi:hypothetical protein